MNFITEFFAKMFNNNIALATILISTIPIIELRGAIPFATNSKLWGKLAVSNWKAMGYSLIGSSLIVPIVALIFTPIINWLKRTRPFRKLAIAIENRIKDKTSKISGNEQKSARFSREYWKKLLAVFVFVAVPLPFTGVWTGSCVSVFLGLDYLSTCITVMLGNVVAGLAIALILQFFPWLNDYLLWIFLAIVAVIIIYEIIKHIINRHKQNETKSN